MVSFSILMLGGRVNNDLQASATVSDSVPIETAHEDMIVRRLDLLEVLFCLTQDILIFYILA